MAKYKFKLSEMSKTASPDDAEKELGTPKRKFQVGQVTYSDDGTSSSEITKVVIDKNVIESSKEPLLIFAKNKTTANSND